MNFTSIRTPTKRNKITQENGETLLDDLSGFVRRYMVLSPAQSDISALWVIHTHAADAAEFTPYLHIFSPVLRSGKTQLLKILSAIVLKPWFTGRVTSAVLVRKTHAQHPTLLLDESDTAFSAGFDYAETLRGVLNTGFDRKGAYSMCDRNGESWDLRDFSTFSPKAIAGIGRLPDTVQDRSIPIKLKRKLPTETCERFREKLVRPVAEQLRTRIVRWVKANLKKLQQSSPSLPEELNDRQQDVCEPLLAIADLAEGEWPVRARRALLELCNGQVNPDESIGTVLLTDICSWFAKNGADRVQTRTLLKYLNSLEESPWGEFKSGRRLTAQGLAKLLRAFDIRPRDIRFGLGIQIRIPPRGVRRVMEALSTLSGTRSPVKRATGATSGYSCGVPRRPSRATERVCCPQPTGQKPNKFRGCRGCCPFAPILPVERHHPLSLVRIRRHVFWESQDIGDLQEFVYEVLVFHQDQVVLSKFLL